LFLCLQNYGHLVLQVTKYISQEGTSLRSAVLLRRRVKRSDTPLPVPTLRRIRQPFHGSIRAMGWCAQPGIPAHLERRCGRGGRSSVPVRLTVVRKSLGTGRGSSRRKAAASGRGVSGAFAPPDVVKDRRFRKVLFGFPGFWTQRGHTHLLRTFDLSRRSMKFPANHDHRCGIS
jgi:hypothetical protein